MVGETEAGPKRLEVRFKTTPPNVPSSLASPIGLFYGHRCWGRLDQPSRGHATEMCITSGKAPQPLLRPRVIHKHDGLAVIFLHLQHKCNERMEAERVCVSVACPSGVVLKWMGKEKDEKER